MKILLITQNFYPELGSAANRIGVLLKLLKQKHEEVYVLTTDPAYPIEQLFSEPKYYADQILNNLEKKHVIRIKTKSKKQNNSFISRLLHYLEEAYQIKKYLSENSAKFDYIYVTTPNIIIAWATLFFRNKKSTYILEVRDLWPDSVNDIKGINIKFLMPILRLLEKKMYNSADKIVINNQYFEHHITNKLKNSKPMHYLPNAVLKSEIKKVEKLEEFTVIYTGNVGHAQDTNQLIKIAEKLNLQKINFKAIIYGANTDYFKESVKHLDYVFVYDPMPREDCLAEISKSHVALSILRSTEVFLNVLPGKVVDAISMGTIPITNLGGITANIINDNNIGYANDKNDIDELVNIILSIKNDDIMRNQMIQNAIKYRNENFIWQDNIASLEKFILGSE